MSNEEATRQLEAIVQIRERLTANINFEAERFQWRLCVMEGRPIFCPPSGTNEAADKTLPKEA